MPFNFALSLLNEHSFDLNDLDNGDLDLPTQADINDMMKGWDEIPDFRPESFPLPSAFGLDDDGELPF